MPHLPPGHGPVRAQDLTSPGPVTSFQLRPGLVVDTAKDQAYVMSPDGGIAALDLARGAELWRSRDAAKPLAMSGDLLVSQGEATSTDNRLRVVSTSTRDGGRTVGSQTIALPADVRVGISPSAAGTFSAQAHTAAPGTTTVTWEYVTGPRSGMPPRPAEVLPGEAANPSETRRQARASAAGRAVTRGAFRLDLGSSSVTPESSPAPTARAAQTAGPPPPSLAGVPEPQFLSADGRHVLHSELVADDTEADKWQWTIYEVGGGSPIGRIRHSERFSPFFVQGGRLVLETPPQASGSGQALQPPHLQAIDLASGQRLWSQPMRDINRRAPPP